MSDRDEKGDELTDRISRRFSGDSNTDEGSKTPKESKPSETAEDSETQKVTDLPSVLMYLPEELKQDLSIRFDELNARYKREHDEELQKNRDYYAAVVEAAFRDDVAVEDLLFNE